MSARTALIVVASRTLGLDSAIEPAFRHRAQLLPVDFGWSGTTASTEAVV
ncbi:hypothetical protein [Streptomyces sp. NPDC048516]